MAFATASQLATRLGRQFTSAETSQASALLEDATSYLQAEIGQLIEAGSMTVTLDIDPTCKRARLPQWPVVSVTSVQLNGITITDFEVKDGHVCRARGFPATVGNQFATLTVEYAYGCADIPAELVTYTLVLAAGVIAQVARSGSLSAAGVQSERIDDYAVNYEPGTAAFELPERVLKNLRARYGSGAYVTGSR